MTEKTYTGQQVKEMLGKSMKEFQRSMIGLIRECSNHPRYCDLSGKEALQKVADKLEELR